MYLNNPVNVGNVETSGSDVGTQEDARFGIAKLEKSCRSFSLLLLSLKEIVKAMLIFSFYWEICLFKNGH